MKTKTVSLFVALVLCVASIAAVSFQPLLQLALTPLALLALLLGIQAIGVSTRFKLFVSAVCSVLIVISVIDCFSHSGNCAQRLFASSSPSP